MVKSKATEKGQVIVLFAIALIVLFGFAALAIDMSAVQTERRAAQNAADAAALSAASAIGLGLENAHINYDNFDCYNSRAITAMHVGIQDAIESAASNDFILDTSIADLNGVQIFCGEQEGSLYDEKYVDVTVQISTTTSASFSQFLFPSDSLKSQVQAISRIWPRMPLAYGYAIVALNPEDCSGHQNGLVIHGTADSYIKGGGAFSNGCLCGDGTPSLHITDGQIGYGASFIAGNAVWDPAPRHVSDQIPPEAYAVPDPDCNAPGAHRVKTLKGTLEPGLYCLTGNLSINGNDTLIGHGVTIYVPNGFVHINGNATVQLSAPSTSPDPSPAIPGILFYMPADNDLDISINGNSESWYAGTILAPGGTVDVEGNSVITAYRTQIIGWNVNIGGTADCGVTFDGGVVHTKPTCIELNR
jgi:type II secretory pathway pseudopilin PulG